MQVPKAPALIIVREQGLMKENRTAELKRIARGKMLDKYGTAIGAYLLQAVIMGIVQYIALQVSDTTTVMGMIVYMLISLIIELIMVVFAVGELTIYFNISRGAEAKATDVFNGFKLHPDKAITVAVLVLVRSYVLLLPAIIAYVYFMLSGKNSAFCSDSQVMKSFPEYMTGTRTVSSPPRQNTNRSSSSPISGGTSVFSRSCVTPA